MKGYRRNGVPNKSRSFSLDSKNRDIKLSARLLTNHGPSPLVPIFFHKKKGTLLKITPYDYAGIKTNTIQAEFANIHIHNFYYVMFIFLQTLKEIKTFAWAPEGTAGPKPVALLTAGQHMPSVPRHWCPAPCSRMWGGREVSCDACSHSLPGLLERETNLMAAIAEPLKLSLAATNPFLA
jgi:hypothetical protein